MQLRHLKTALTLLGIAGLLTPLLARSSSSGTLPVTTTAFQAVVEVMFALWLVWLWYARPKINWRQPLLVGAGIFLATLLLTLPFSRDVSLSFWSTLGRSGGLFTLLHLFGWLLMLSTLWTEWEDWLAPLVVTSLGCLLFVDLKAWTEMAAGVNRASSLFGNPLTTASYVLLHVWLALLLAWRFRAKWAKATCLLLAAAHVFTIVLTASRGALLALLPSIFIFVTVGIWQTSTNRRVAKILVVVVGILAALTTGAFFLLRSPQMKPWSNAHLPFVVSRFMQANLGADRLTLWRIAYDGFRDRPLFGNGLGSYMAVFNEHFEPAGADVVLTETWYDKPHNLHLEILQSVGVIGLLGYLALWCGLGWSLRRAWRQRTDNADRGIILGIGALVVSYLVQATFLFFLLPIELVLFTALALLASMPSWPTADAKRTSRQERRQDDRRRVFGPVLLLALAVALIGGYFLNYVPRQLTQVNDRAWLAANRDPQQTADDLRRSFGSRAPYGDDLRFNTSYLLKYVVENEIMPARAYQPTLMMLADELQARADAKPNDYRMQIYAAQMLRLAAVDAPELLDESDRLLERALTIAPQRIDAEEELGENSFARGDSDEGRRHYEAAIEKTASVNRQDYLRTRLVGALALSGATEEAAELLSEVIARRTYSWSSDARPALPLAEAVIDGRLKPKAVQTYFNGLASRAAGKPSAMRALSLFHAKTGATDKAQADFTEFRRLRGDLAEELRVQLKELGIEVE